MGSIFTVLGLTRLGMERMNAMTIGFTIISEEEIVETPIITQIFQAVRELQIFKLLNYILFKNQTK